MRYVVVSALLLLMASAASGQVDDRLADLRLATAVRLALVDDARTRALDVDVAARRGAVEVEGDLTAVQRRLLDDVARAVAGVRSLNGVGSGTEPASGPAVTIPERRVPEAAPARTERTEAEPTYHRVERGDTLFSLARRYGTTVEAIRDLNDLRGTGIRMGQRLRVR